MKIRLLICAAYMRNLHTRSISNLYHIVGIIIESNLDQSYLEYKSWSATLYEDKIADLCHLCEKPAYVANFQLWSHC